MSEFSICARHSTPTFGVIQPQHQAIPVLSVTVLPQAPLHIDQHQELTRAEIMSRILPSRPTVPRDHMIFHYHITYTNFQ